jgi:glycosyltransferase involved in cell wall biosynthesis
VVVVDDGSTDGRTVRFLGEVERRPGMTVHRTENRGPAMARNTAVERSRGAYIVPLDADDYLAPSFLAETVAVLDGEPDIGMAYTWIGLVGGHRGTWRTGGFSIPELLCRCTVHVTALYRRELWADVGGYDPLFVESCEDWDFWLSAVARGWQARCIPKVLAYYRRRKGSRGVRARERGVSARLMRSLVTKHRALYERHLEDAMAGLFEEYSSVCLSLERVYEHPAVSLGLRLRSLLRGGGGP